MPRIATAHFGPLDYLEDSVIEFPAGLPAFEDQTRFVLIEQADSAPLVFLQSLLRPELAFPALPVQLLAPDYRLDASAEEGLPAFPGPDVVCLAIITAPAGVRPTANLAAPVVVNLATRQAGQVIRTDAVYSHRHPLPVAAEPAPCS